MQLLNFDWPANILAGLNFRAQEIRLMSPDGVCAISAGPVGHETKECTLPITTLTRPYSMSILYYTVKVSKYSTTFISDHLDKMTTFVLQ